MAVRWRPGCMAIFRLVVLWTLGAEGKGLQGLSSSLRV